MKRLIKTLATVLAFSTVACTSEIVDYTDPNIDDSKIPVVKPPTEASALLSSVAPKDVESSNSFALKFYLANAAETPGNVCVSPFSVGSVLGMIANGDDGICRDEILSLLGFEAGETGLNALNTHYQTLLSNLPNIDDSVKCNFTNTLWCDPTTPIREPFMETISDYYYTAKIDISPKGEYGKKAINQFVSKNTHGLIPEFLKQPLTSELAFLNTSYFKAPWFDSFKEDNTKQGTFHDVNNKEQKADFMCKASTARYTKLEDGSQVVKLDYGHNKKSDNNTKFSMILILPSSDIPPSAIDKVMTEENKRHINNNLYYDYIFIKLPKFEVEYNNPKTLDILKKIGLENVCSGMPFCQISDLAEYYLNSFIHATKLKVDENGTEGAAASMAEMAYGASSEIPKPREIVFDRPFLFYIQENTTGSILFIGSVKTLS